VADGDIRRPDGPFSALGVGVSLSVVLLDQLAKASAEARLEFGQTIELLPVLTLYRVHNTGIAFSMLTGSGGVLIAVMLAVMALVVVFWQRSHDGGQLVAIGFALILGGALGNLIDRVRLGYVVDFLLLHLGERTLFVFNLADAALTLGPALLIVAYFISARR
jgi:signal peptidase II